MKTTRRLIKAKLLLSLILLPTLALGQKPQPQPPDPPQGTTPLTQTQIDRIYCLQPVIDAMKTIWAATSDGTGDWEAAFIVSHIGGIYIEPMERGRPYSQTVLIFGNTVALFHVHPNRCVDDNARCIWPSTPDDNYEHNGMGDTGMADKEKIDIYVVSKEGLTRYRPGVGNSIEKTGMTWTTAGKECK